MTHRATLLATAAVVGFGAYYQSRELSTLPASDPPGPPPLPLSTMTVAPSGATTSAVLLVADATTGATYAGFLPSPWWFLQPLG